MRSTSERRRKTDLFSKVKAWVTGETLLVEHIISNFMSTVKKLEQHAEESFKNVLHYDNIVAEAEKASVFFEAERIKALAVAAKIKALLS